jgi:hypothetical protein
MGPARRSRYDRRVRRLLTWIVVTLGIAALVRRLRSRSHVDEIAPPAPADSGDPANELRRKLDESRATEPAGGASPAAEPDDPAAAATVEERRASVHEQGRSTLDEMRGPDES